MVTRQSVQRHTGLTHPFQFFDIRALWRSADIRHARNAARAVVSSNSYNNKPCRPFSLTQLHVSHTPLSTISNQVFSVTILCLEHVISTPSLPTFMKARLFSLSFPWVHAQSLCCENICHSGCYNYLCYLLAYEARQSPSMADYHTWNKHQGVHR